jgi:hypothetical protein
MNHWAGQTTQSRCAAGKKSMRISALGVLIAAAIAIGTPVLAGDSHPWDATWAGGFDNGADGVQIIIAGDEIIGFFFHGDYMDVAGQPVAADGSLTFTWEGGSGKLTAKGDRHQLAIHEEGAADRVIELKQDHGG